jgi:hypothetical protein
MKLIGMNARRRMRLTERLGTEDSRALRSAIKSSVQALNLDLDLN